MVRALFARQLGVTPLRVRVPCPPLTEGDVMTRKGTVF